MTTSPHRSLRKQPTGDRRDRNPRPTGRCTARFARRARRASPTGRWSARPWPRPVDAHRALDSEDTRVMIDVARATGARRSTTTRRRPRSASAAAAAGCRRPRPSSTWPTAARPCVPDGDGRARPRHVPARRHRPHARAADRGPARRARATRRRRRERAGNGCPPVVVRAAGLPGGRATVAGDISSQFLSGLLMAAPCAAAAGRTGRRRAAGLAALRRDDAGRDGGVRRRRSRPRTSAASSIPAPQRYRGRQLRDRARRLGRQLLLRRRGDHRRARSPSRGFRATACRATWRSAIAWSGWAAASSTAPTGSRSTGGPLRGIDVDMNAISDTVQTLAAVALFADGPTTITGVAHIRHKETDRLARWPPNCASSAPRSKSARRPADHAAASSTAPRSTPTTTTAWR